MTKKATVKVNVEKQAHKDGGNNYTLWTTNGAQVELNKVYEYSGFMSDAVAMGYRVDVQGKTVYFGEYNDARKRAYEEVRKMAAEIEAREAAKAETEEAKEIGRIRAEARRVLELEKQDSKHVDYPKADVMNAKLDTFDTTDSFRDHDQAYYRAMMNMLAELRPDLQITEAEKRDSNRWWFNPYGKGPTLTYYASNLHYVEIYSQYSTRVPSSVLITDRASSLAHYAADERYQLYFTDYRVYAIQWFSCFTFVETFGAGRGNFYTGQRRERALHTNTKGDYIELQKVRVYKHMVEAIEPEAEEVDQLAGRREPMNVVAIREAREQEAADDFEVPSQDLQGTVKPELQQIIKQVRDEYLEEWLTDYGYISQEKPKRSHTLTDLKVHAGDKQLRRNKMYVKYGAVGKDALYVSMYVLDKLKTYRPLNEFIEKYDVKVSRENCSNGYEGQKNMRLVLEFK